jgi:hypothetical protein
MADEEALLAFDDGLVCPEVGGWTEEKHRHVSLYSTLFSSGMKEGKARAASWTAALTTNIRGVSWRRFLIEHGALRSPRIS